MSSFTILIVHLGTGIYYARCQIYIGIRYNLIFIFLLDKRGKIFVKYSNPQYFWDVVFTPTILLSTSLAIW